MTFVKLIKDLTLSFGEIQERMQFIITFARKEPENDKTEKKN